MRWRHATIDWSFACSAATELTALVRLAGVVSTDAMVAELAQLASRTGKVDNVAMTPDGNRIVTVSSDMTARIWDAHTRAELALLKGHTGPFDRIHMARNATRIVTHTSDGKTRIWDVNNGAELAQFEGPSGRIDHILLTSDGTRIVTVGWHDKIVRIWDAITGAELAELMGNTAYLTSVAITVDGARIVTGATDGAVRIWEVFPSGQALIDQAKGIAPRCLTNEQRKFYHLAPLSPGWCGTLHK